MVQCASILEPSLLYDVPYDKLVIGVGAVSNDFNVPGVKEHALFLKVWCDPMGVCSASQQLIAMSPSLPTLEKH